MENECIQKCQLFVSITCVRITKQQFIGLVVLLTVIKTINKTSISYLKNKNAHLVVNLLKQIKKTDLFAQQSVKVLILRLRNLMFPLTGQMFVLFVCSQK